MFTAVYACEHPFNIIEDSFLTCDRVLWNPEPDS